MGIHRFHVFSSCLRKEKLRIIFTKFFVKLISHEKFKSMCPGPLFVYATMYHHQEKEEVLQYYLILPRKVLFDSFVKKKLRIDYEHFLFFFLKKKTLFFKKKKKKKKKKS